MERCQEHMVADGEIERSKKLDGKVIRGRVCSKCGEKFGTMEMTDDWMAYRLAEVENQIRLLHHELAYAKGIMDLVAERYRIEEKIKNYLKERDEFGGAGEE